MRKLKGKIKRGKAPGKTKRGKALGKGKGQQQR